MKRMEFSALVRQRLKETRQTQHGAAVENGLPADAIRSVLKGHTPKVDRAAEICTALGLEFYIGPPRKPASPNSTVEDFVTQQGAVRGKAKRPAWVEDLRTEIRGLSDRLGTADESAARQVEVRELAAAAGGGAAELDERVVGLVAFQRTWLDRHVADPNQCTVISVKGDSMEPTLPDGSKILVDRSQNRRRTNRIFVVWTGGGLMVKRAMKNRAGQWLLSSDNDSTKPMAWPEEARVIGEVKWVGRTL